MRGEALTICSGAAAILLFSAGSSAHHGTAAAYDLNQTVSITGTVTDFQFTNPHVLIFFDVMDQDGVVVTWSAGLTSPLRVARSDGWSKDTLKPGDQISITGYPARSGAPSLWVEQIFLDGKPLLSQRYRYTTG
jgi:hypothetical protein